MTLLPSLLRVISSVDGECLVLHSGKEPCVSSESGEVRLAQSGLTGQAVTRILERVLPEESWRALGAEGTAQHEFDVAEFPADRFSVLATRSGDHLRVEIRRRGVRSDDRPLVEVSPRPAIEESLAASRVGEPFPAQAADGPADPLFTDGAGHRLNQLLRLATSRGASTLYVSSGVRPSIRVEGEMQLLASSPVTSAGDVEAMLLTILPEETTRSLGTGPPITSIGECPGVGHVRCTSFHDHRGLGGVFHVMPTRAARSQHLGLSREIQRLATEPDGLILVAGPSTRDEPTLGSALVDLINRTRRVRVATVECQIGVVHEQDGSFISQHEVGGGSEDALRATCAALGEHPDVLVLECRHDAALMTLALDAAASGRLVICATADLSATAAVDAVIEMFPEDDRAVARQVLALVLRGVIVQVLVNTTNGGRIAARELLLNSPAVARAIADGRTSELPTAIASGRQAGMVSLSEALAALVQSGVVDLREAFRHAGDKAEFAATLRRQGIDPSSIAPAV